MQLSHSSATKVGVALIVSNDYVTNDTKLVKLDGTHKHADKMIAAFSKIGYAVFHFKNMTYYELTSIIDHIAALLPFISCKHLAFMFSGYGTPGKQNYDYVRDDESSSGEDEENKGDNEVTRRDIPKEDMSGQLYTQDGWTLSVAEILEYFGAYKLPKLLLFDLCHIAESKWSGCDKLLNLDHYSEDDNFLVAYSMLPFKNLHFSNTWIELLSEAIQTQNNDIALILYGVNNKLKEPQTSFEIPQFDNMLEKPVNLLSKLPNGNVKCIGIIIIK